MMTQLDLFATTRLPQSIVAPPSVIPDFLWDGVRLCTPMEHEFGLRYLIALVRGDRSENSPRYERGSHVGGVISGLLRGGYTTIDGTVTRKGKAYLRQYVLGTPWEQLVKAETTLATMRVFTSEVVFGKYVRRVSATEWSVDRMEGTLRCAVQYILGWT